MGIWRKDDFHISEFGGGAIDPPAHERLAEYRPAEQVAGGGFSFRAVCRELEKHLAEKLKARDDSEARKWLQLQHDAVVGKPEAVQLFRNEIEEYLRSARLEQVLPPPPYESLVEAVFQETFGLGPISAWWQHPSFAKSQSARIMGTRIFFDIPGERALQPFAYESEQHVLDMIDKIKLRDDFANISKFNPKLEIDLDDGTRVMIMIPPRVRKPTLIFRNYTMKDPVLEDFVRTGTLPADSLPIVKALARTMLNLAAVGKVRSGKTTFLKALFRERYRPGQVAVVIERGHSEIKLGDLHPDAQIIEMITKKDADYEDIFDQVLRSDYHFCVVSEMRSIEAEVFNLSCERGEGGAMTSLHTDELENIPGLMARILLQRYPNRKYEEEVIRVARNLHLAFGFKEVDGQVKRLVRLAEIRLDPVTFEVSAHDVIRWDHDLQDWTYCFDLSERTLSRMKEQAPEYAELGIRALRDLALAKPMAGTNVSVSLSHNRRETGGTAC